jgi:hypothetical protein
MRRTAAARVATIVTASVRNRVCMRKLLCHERIGPDAISLFVDGIDFFHDGERCGADSLGAVPAGYKRKGRLRRPFPDFGLAGDVDDR